MRAIAGNRYVRTQAIQAAVRGSETKILAALGIRPQGAGHIKCPFPDHDDANPSWRWDQRKARAYCTCANGHALSIFEVLGRLEAIDFEASKIRAAELIGRAELIEQKGAGSGTKMTAGRLLSPPADRSVPEVPRAYLAHRLGVEPDDVPIPATPVAGWRDLEYFDPPTGKGGRPCLVGKHPCAVFGTVAADGRTHAHRIYVQPRGQGKAELGEGRDAKKSATLPAGVTATGCAVIWGDRDRAPWLLLAEGSETAAAIAFAFRTEIEAGEVYVAAATSRAGVARFDPWSATKRITVCADRDEAKPKNAHGYRDGEKAAFQFAAEHHDLDVTIALPGQSGIKIDWLDVLRAEGPEAVRAGIIAAEPPTSAPEGALDEADDDRAKIYCAGGSLPKNVADAERLLAQANPDDPARRVYQRAGVLVRIARLPLATAANGIRRTAGSLQILTAGPDFLRLRLTEIATWLRFDKRSNQWVQTDAPPAVARTLIDIPGMWPNTPNLAGIIEAPALRPDGTIIERPGYDEASGLYFDPGLTDFPGIPARPSRCDAAAALDLLLEIIAGFPFVDEPSRSVALALLITPLVRHAVRAAPLTGISAPKMGSGKTLLAHLPAYIATSRAPSLMAQADDPLEEKKRLLALLLEGSIVTVIDNCERPLKSDALCTALTETVIRERILGSTRTISVPTTTTWVATGNGLAFDGDLSSRTVLCTLDPACEHPEEREFDVNLHVDIPQRRGELAAAAITIVKAFLAAGAPRQGIPTFGRFEEWSRFVREPLVWLGCADPYESRRAIEARDQVRDRLGNLLEAWHAAFKDNGQTVNTAIEIADTNGALRAALQAVAEDRGKISARRIGRFLAKYERRIERGYRAVSAGTRSNATLWSVSFVSFVSSATTARAKRQNTPDKVENDSFHEELGTNSRNSRNSPAADRERGENMSAATRILARARSVGIVLEARGDRIAYGAPAGAMTPDFRDEIRLHKAELLEELSARAEPLKTEVTPQSDVWPCTARPDVVAVVEDLADGHMRPRAIASKLGLTIAEVLAILRRTGR